MIICKCDLCGDEIKETSHCNPLLKIDFCSTCASKKLGMMLKEYNQIKKESDEQFDYVISNMIKKYVKLKEDK